MIEEPKIKSKSVSLHPDLWDEVEALAQKKYGGNRSAYLRDLIIRDMASGPVSLSELNNAWLDLLRAERLARDWMFCAPDKKDTAVRALIEHVLDTTRRRTTYPVKEDDAALQAAEASPAPPAKGEREKSA